jgi:glycine/serine hydroxymethyltransferase
MFSLYKGNFLQSSDTFWIDFSFSSSSLGLSSLSAMTLPTSSKACSSKPLVVRAAEPSLSPLVTNGDSGSKGTVFPGTQGGPLEHVIAAKAVAFKEASEFEFKLYCQRVISNAVVLSNQLQKRGISIVSKGTDNHIVLLDLRSINMTGKIADQLVSDIKITANKNTVPFDPESPFVTSGLRLGSAALTTRGFDEQAFEDVGNVIADRLLNPNDEELKEKSIQKVSELCKKFPLYSENI